MALLDQAPSTTPQQATATGYTPTTADAKTATSQSYDPNAFQVTPEQTVEGRLSGIISADSPLMQQARTRALQYANSRGLINSSLAAGEAQARMVDAAMPIAQQDAGAFNQAMTNTVNAKNAAAGFKATAENAASQTNAQLGTNVNLANQNATNTAQQFGANAYNTASITNAQLGTSTNLANLDAALKTSLANLDSQTKTELATIDGNYKQLLQTNQDAASAYNQTVQNIAAISQNSSLTQDAKDDAIATQMNMLNELLRQQSQTATTSTTNDWLNLNLAPYFGGGNYTG